MKKHIFFIGFPKCGTSSFTKAFENAGKKVFHEKTNNGETLGQLFIKAKNKRRPLLEYCNDYDVFTQMDNSGYETDTPFFPQIDCLDVLLSQYPFALYIYQWRPFDKWWESVVKWLMIPTWEKWPISKKINHFQNNLEGIKNKWEFIYTTHSKICKKKFKNKGNFLWLDITQPNEIISKKLQKFCKNSKIKVENINVTSEKKLKMREKDEKVYFYYEND